MAFLQVNFFSKVLGISSSINVILPEPLTLSKSSRQPPAVLYLLHGLSDDHTIWQHRTSIERYAADKNLAVIMPAVQRSFYTDMKHGYRYFTFLARELPQVVKSMFSVSDKKENTFVCGLSMGGYGALKLAFLAPENFGAVASLSGAVDLRRLYREADQERKGEFDLIFGSLDEFSKSDHDLWTLAPRAAQKKLPVFLACGRDDFLYTDNLRLHSLLKELDYPVTWREKAGIGHVWSFWDEMVAEVITWLDIPLLEA